MKSADLLEQVTAVVRAQPITDMHTHCYAPRFGASPADGAFLLWGIDELLTYHYLVAEVYRVDPATARAAPATRSRRTRPCPPAPRPGTARRGFVVRRFNRRVEGKDMCLPGNARDRTGEGAYEL